MQSLCHYLLFGIVVVGVVCVGGQLDPSSTECNIFRITPTSNAVLCPERGNGIQSCKMDCLCTHALPDGTCDSRGVCKCSNDQNLPDYYIAAKRNNECRQLASNTQYGLIVNGLCPPFRPPKGMQQCNKDCMCIHGAKSGECFYEPPTSYGFPTCKCYY